jgi:hypothetical protein
LNLSMYEPALRHFRAAAGLFRPAFWKPRWLVRHPRGVRIAPARERRCGPCRMGRPPSPQCRAPRPFREERQRGPPVPPCRLCRPRGRSRGRSMGAFRPEGGRGELSSLCRASRRSLVGRRALGSRLGANNGGLRPLEHPALLLVRAVRAPRAYRERPPRHACRPVRPPYRPSIPGPPPASTPKGREAPKREGVSARLRLSNRSYRVPEIRVPLRYG